MTAFAYEIVPAGTADVESILQIEEACFSAPWTRKMVEAELTGNPFARFLLAKDRNEVREKPSRVVGYLCFWVVFEEVRLMNLAVIEPKRRSGLATALVTAALQEGISQAATRAVLEVRASNTAAQSLYARFGFRRVSVRAKYYANPVEDAVLMELEPIALGRRADPSASYRREV